MSAPVVIVQELTVTIDRGASRLELVRGVSFDVFRGEIFALVGESGAGKSTVGLSLGRLNEKIPGIRYGGSIVVDGVQVLTASENELRRLRGARIGIVLQDPSASLDPLQRAGRHVSEAISAHTPGISKREVRQAALGAMKTAGMRDAERYFDSYPHELSGGLRQRVAIAGAIALQPSILVADEPTTALDTSVQAQVLVELARLARREGVAILLVTHDLGVVSELADRVAVMYAGRIVEYGSVVDVLSRPQHPYTVALVDAIPRLADGGPAASPSMPQTSSASSGAPLQPRDGCAFAPRCSQAMEQCRTGQPPLIGIGEGRAVECWLHATSDQTALAER